CYPALLLGHWNAPVKVGLRDLLNLLHARSLNGFLQRLDRLQLALCGQAQDAAVVVGLLVQVTLNLEIIDSHGKGASTLDVVRLVESLEGLNLASRLPQTCLQREEQDHHLIREVDHARSLQW